MEIASKAFKEMERIPDRHVMPAAGGENISIPLAWADPPKGTASFALTVVDAHPAANDWIYWMVINIPPDVRSIAEGASGHNMPPGAAELMNSFGKPGYGGPQPPKGTEEHPYVCTIYALNTDNLDFEGKPVLSEFKSAIRGKVLEHRSVTGVFGR